MKKSNSSVVIHMFLQPESWGQYKKLQAEISKIIPTEEQRPTIHLMIATEKDRAKYTIGIIGGIGPLSDTEILRKIMVHLLKHHKNKLHSLAIHLLSSPPPRSIWEIITRGPQYYHRLKNFMQSGYTKYYIASNAGHLYFEIMRKLIPAQSTLVNLVDVISQKAAEKIKNNSPRILVLGPLSSYKRALYPSYLLRHKLACYTLRKGRCRNCFYALSSDQKARELQQYIDMAKRGETRNAGEKIKDFIVKTINYIQQQGGVVDRIILGCTELSMALHNDPNLIKIIRDLNLTTNQTDLDLIDTEDLFAKKIIVDIEKMLQYSCHPIVSYIHNR